MENKEKALEISPAQVPVLTLDLEGYEDHLRKLDDFVKRNMVKDTDYGTMPGVSKPSLYKAGAEQLCKLFQLTPALELINSQEDWDNGFFHYSYRVKLYHRGNEQFVGEGIGSCNSKEKRYRGQDPYTLNNTIMKMAKKRALVDAVLTVTAASRYFTQDVEDIGIEPEAPPKPAPRPSRKPEMPTKQELEEFIKLFDNEYFNNDEKRGWTDFVDRGPTKKQLMIARRNLERQLKRRMNEKLEKSGKASSPDAEGKEAQ